MQNIFNFRRCALRDNSKRYQRLSPVSSPRRFAYVPIRRRTQVRKCGRWLCTHQLQVISHYTPRTPILYNTPYTISSRRVARLITKLKFKWRSTVRWARFIGCSRQFIMRFYRIERMGTLDAAQVLWLGTVEGSWGTASAASANKLSKLDWKRGPGLCTLDCDCVLYVRLLTLYWGAYNEFMLKVCPFKLS